jgi:hypothetical protein
MVTLLEIQAQTRILPPQQIKHSGQKFTNSKETTVFCESKVTKSDFQNVKNHNDSITQIFLFFFN